ncbi:MAG: Omp28-related outer membrane protein, partial [Bacteroidetes bacterium]|nr:Omp28-related outer membrane protein [Bacteroidota bacterium]
MKDTCLFFIILASLIFVGTLNAQTPKWVSTEVQNYTAVLEHFTSIYSGNCADGHRISNELAKKYKDKLIIINNYCDTEFVQILKPYYPDLTTAEGYTIYSHAGEKGELPGINTGSINRSTGPWAIIPDKWQNTIEYILNKKSIVNVYIKPTLNEINRELTVEIEYFYTDDAPVYIKDGNAPDPLTAKNYLTVMLLQNEIVGYQKDGKRLNPEYALNDTLYRHMHVLRKIISDGDAGGDSDGDTWSPSDGNAWGDLITNTKKGNYGYRKYTIILPDSINNIPLDLANLEVVAFISAKGSYIYSGHKAAVEISKDVKTDLAVEDITEYHNT